MYRSVFGLTPEGTKTIRNHHVAVTTSQTVTDCAFWRPLANLTSAALQVPQSRLLGWFINFVMMFTKLLTSKHFERVLPHILPEYTIHRRYAYINFSSQFLITSIWITTQLLPSVFDVFLGANTSFAASSLYIRGCTNHRKTLYNFPNGWTVHNRYVISLLSSMVTIIQCTTIINSSNLNFIYLK